MVLSSLSSAHSADGFASQLRHRFCTAPMMDWSDRHCRHFWRQLSHQIFLYTEMVTTGALLHSKREAQFLGFHEIEHPVALQLGGSDPQDLARCAKLVQYWGYDEINFNVGCPSPRVQNHRIGACLMGDPQHVRDCMSAMIGAVQCPVTIKHRLGIDDCDSYQALCAFVGTVAESGCKTFIVHARKAILQGLSPKDNRQVPPLDYQKVYQLKQDFPHLEIILNGGLLAIDQMHAQLNQVDGIMVGREVYQNPWLLVNIDQVFYGQTKAARDRAAVIIQWLPYVESQLKLGVPLQHMTRHLLGLFRTQKGGRQFRRYLSENAFLPGAGIEVLEKALTFVHSLGKNQEEWLCE